MMDDRTDGNILQITQTLLADMSGVYRPTITNALREFEKATAKIQTDNSECDNNPRKSECENVAHVVSCDAASGPNGVFVYRHGSDVNIPAHRALLNAPSHLQIGVYLERRRSLFVPEDLE